MSGECEEKEVSQGQGTQVNTVRRVPSIDWVSATACQTQRYHMSKLSSCRCTRPLSSHCNVVQDRIAHRYLVYPAAVPLIPRGAEHIERIECSHTILHTQHERFLQSRRATKYVYSSKERQNKESRNTASTRETERFHGHV